MGSVVKTHEEALSQWVSDEIEFLVGASRNKFQRAAFEKIVKAINEDLESCHVYHNNIDHLMTRASWCELKTALRKHNQVLTTAFLCHFESFIEAAFAVDPPDTLLMIQERQKDWSSLTSAATTQGRYVRA